MIFVVFALSFVISCIAIYIVSFFSGQNSDPISVIKTTWIIWWVSVILNIFGIGWVIWMGISTIVSMVSFMKFLWFEPTPSFFAWLLYSVIYYFLLLVMIWMFVW